MQRYDWVSSGMSEDYNGGWVLYDDVRQAVGEAVAKEASAWELITRDSAIKAELRGAEKERAAVVAWLRETELVNAADAIADREHLVNEHAPAPPQPTTDDEVCNECGFVPAVGNRIFYSSGRGSKICPSCNPAPPQPTTVLEMVEASLKAGGHDGLYNETGYCGCILGDLSPCGCISGACVAAKEEPDGRMVPARVKP